MTLHPRRCERVLDRVLDDDQLVLVTEDGARMLVINPMGSAIWDLCDGARSVEEIIAFVCDHADGAPRAQVAGDVARFITELQDAGFVHAGSA